MKNILVRKCLAVIIGVLLGFSLLACSNTGNNNDETKESTKEISTGESHEVIDISGASFITPGKLTVGMVIDYPPFEYFSSNGTTPIGIDVDITNAIAKKLGLELEIKNVPWDDELFTSIGTKYDVVCSAVTITDDRLKDMIFSNSYIDNYQSVVVRSGSNMVIKSFEDLGGLKVAVQKDTVSDELVQSLIKDKNISIQLTENEVATDCFDELKAGSIEAIVCDSTVAEGQVARNTKDYVEAFRDENNVEKFAIAIGKNNKGLQTAINKALEILHTEGADKRIISSWFSR